MASPLMRNSRLGVALIVIGVVLLAGGIVSFFQTLDILSLWLAELLCVCLVVLGSIQVSRAKRLAAAPGNPSS